MISRSPLNISSSFFQIDVGTGFRIAAASDFVMGTAPGVQSTPPPFRHRSVKRRAPTTRSESQVRGTTRAGRQQALPFSFDRVFHFDRVRKSIWTASQKWFASLPETNSICLFASAEFLVINHNSSNFLCSFSWYNDETCSTRNFPSAFGRGWGRIGSRRGGGSARAALLVFFTEFDDTYASP